MSFLSRFFGRGPSRKIHPPSTIEVLEHRIAPAVFINPHLVTYTDTDGDHVSIASSRPIFTKTNLDTIFTFHGTASAQQLQVIDFTALGAGAAAGDALNITVQKGPNGDGFANIGIIESDFSLGKISVQGDLGSIQANSTNGAGAALASLTVHSLGEKGLSTQPSGGSATLTSTITGAVGFIDVQQNIVNAQVQVQSAFGTGAGNGSIGSLTVGGSIIGGSQAGSGSVTAGGTIGPIHIGGAIAGGSGAFSGAILAEDSIGAVSTGSLTSGSGASSGEISTGGNLASLDLTSSAPVTGLVEIAGSAGSILIHGNLTGGSKDDTGLFLIGGAVNSIAITGAIKGGTGADSGAIFAGLDNASSISSLSIAGGIQGGGGTSSGQVHAGGSIGRATLPGIAGGTGQASGELVTGGGLGSVFLTGTATGAGVNGVIGGKGADSGRVVSGATISSVILHGSVIGGSGAGSGAIVSSSVFDSSGALQGNIGAITVVGNVIGGSGSGSGQISAAGNLNTVSVGGSVIGGHGDGSGAILAGADLTGVSGGDITALRISGLLEGASISSGKLSGSGYIQAGHIGSASIGAIRAGSASGGAAISSDGAILCSEDIASLQVTGGILGTPSNPVVISAAGEVAPGAGGNLAFGKISVGGSVTYANFLAGYDQSVNPVPSGDASIGSVTVGGNWAGSNLVASVIPGTDGHFGDPHARLVNPLSSLVPAIASIIIEGQVESAPAGASADTYGFVAADVKAFTLHGEALPVKFGLIDPVGDSRDTVVRDVIG